MRLKFLFFLFLLITPILVSSQIIFTKHENIQGETAQVYLDFPDLFGQITTENIIIKYQDLEINLPLYLKKITKTKYFLYFNTGDLDPGNYTLHVNNIKLLESSYLKTKSLNQTFKIQQKNKDILNINPGIIIYPEPINYLEIKNPNQNPINLTLSASDQSINLHKTSLIISKQDSIKITFSIDPKKISISEAKININNYQIPVHFTTYKKDQELNFYLIKENNPIIIDKLNLDIEELIPKEGHFQIINPFDESIENLKLGLTEGLDEIIEINQTIFKTLGPSSSVNFKLSINKDLSPQRDIYDGSLTLKYGKSIKKLPISLNIIYSPVEEQETEQEPREINLDTKTSDKDSYNPEESEKESTNPNLATVIIIVLVIFILLIYFTSDKETTKQDSFKDYIKKLK